MKFDTNKIYTTTLQYDRDICFEMQIIEINKNKNTARIVVTQLSKNELPSELYNRKITMLDDNEFINVSNGIVFCADRYQ